MGHTLLSGCESLWHRHHESENSYCVNSKCSLTGRYLAIKETQGGLAPRCSEPQLKILFKEPLWDFFSDISGKKREDKKGKKWKAQVMSPQCIKGKEGNGPLPC